MRFKLLIGYKTVYKFKMLVSERMMNFIQFFMLPSQAFYLRLLSKHIGTVQGTSHKKGNSLVAVVSKETAS